MSEENIVVEETTTSEAKTDAVDYKAEYEKMKAENEKLRKANTNASADASKYKKELQARMSEQEQAEQKRAEETARMQEELEAFRKEKVVAEHTAQFLSIGMDEGLAKESATAMAENNYSDVFRNFKSFMENHDKELNADAIRRTPRPGTSSEATITKEQFNKMGYTELVKLKQENPELYNELKGE